MPTLDKTLQTPGGISRTCRGQDDGRQPRPILQVAFVESPCRTAVTDNDLDRRGVGNALDMCRHNVANARVARALNVAALDCIPQGHAAVQQHGPLGGNGGIERRAHRLPKDRPRWAARAHRGTRPSRAKNGFADCRNKKRWHAKAPRETTPAPKRVSARQTRAQTHAQYVDSPRQIRPWARLSTDSAPRRVQAQGYPSARPWAHRRQAGRRRTR